MGNAILNNAESSPNIDSIMDTYGRVADNIPDPSGLMINRIHGEINFSIAGPSGYYQHHVLDSTDLFYSDTDHNYGIIGDSYSVFSFGKSIDVVTGSTSPFRIGHFYNFTPGDINGFIMSAGAPGGGEYLGFSTSGSIIYTECEITTRSLPLDWFSLDNPSRDWPIFIEVAGTLNPSRQRARLNQEEKPSPALFTVCKEILLPPLH